ncbi:MAG: hypothetical protein ACM358_04985 [Gemmatimonadota bacterium]
MGAWETLPGWRRNLFGVPSSTEMGSAERNGLREALYELSGSEPRTFAELAAAVREEWGDATGCSIRLQLLTLVRRRALRRTRAGYVRVEEGR